MLSTSFLKILLQYYVTVVCVLIRFSMNVRQLHLCPMAASINYHHDYIIVSLTHWCKSTDRV